MKRNGRDRRAGGECEGGVHAVQRFLLDILNERKLRRGKRRGDAGLIDEDDAEAGAHDRLGRDHVGKADARGNIGEVKLACAARISVYAEVIELLRAEVEDGGLVVLFDRGEVKRIARADVGCQAVGEFKSSCAKYSSI